MKIEIRNSFLAVLVILFTGFIFISCNKKEETGNTTEGSGKTEEKTNESLELSEDFIIKYDLTGKMSGNMTMKKKGDKIKQVINSEVMSKPSNNTVYIDGETAYVVTDVNGVKMGMKMNLKEYNKNKQTGETITDPAEFKKFLEGKKKIGTETILGKEADIYDMGNNYKLSVYKDRYVLKIDSPDFRAVATEIDTSPDFASNEFEIPQDVNFRSADMDMKNMKKNMEGLDSLMKQYKKGE